MIALYCSALQHFLFSKIAQHIFNKKNKKKKLKKIKKFSHTFLLEDIELKFIKIYQSLAIRKRKFKFANQSGLKVEQFC